jgi:ABC-type transporter Mla subunit MlaD
MASLKETAEQLTGRLEELFDELRSDLKDGELDFDKLTSLADQISEQADNLAQTFSSVNETLMQKIEEIKSGDSGSGRKQSAKAESGSRS